MKAYIFDTETTDSDPSTAKPIQASAIEVLFDAGQLQFGDQRTRYYDHGIESQHGALAVHGLSLTTLRSLEPFPGASFSLNDTAPGCAYLIGHNIRFDWEVAGSPAGLRLIDTLKIARYLWPESGSHSLGAMAIQAAEEFLGDKEGMVQRVMQAHNAHYDVQLNYEFLRWICHQGGIDSVDKLWYEYNNTWRFPQKFSFGKHKGRYIAEVVALDRGYAGWCLRQTDMDPDVLEVIKRFM